MSGEGASSYCTRVKVEKVIHLAGNSRSPTSQKISTRHRALKAPITMKIYFCGSIRGGRGDAELYSRIIEQLKAYGTVLTEHVGFKEPILKHIEGDDVAIHTQDMAWLEESDVVVAEVTQPSLGVGYEIGRAVAWKKRILCLYRPADGKGLSAMVRGAHDGKNFIVKDYQEPEVPGILKEFLSTS